MPKAAKSTSAKANSSSKPAYPATPDGRYFVVRGRLWRCTNPDLDPDERQRLTRELMDARRGMRRDAPADQRATAKQRVDDAKVALGERGPVWWGDAQPEDLCDRKMARNTKYKDWWAGLEASEQAQEQ